MSYSSVIKVPIVYTDGTPLFSVDVPAEDIADTLSQRLWPMWGDMLDVGVQKVDNYVQQKWLPLMRAETNRVSEDAYGRASSALFKTGLGFTVLAAGVLGALYWYNKSGK